MSDKQEHQDLAAAISSAKPKTKEPKSVRVLDSWIAHIEAEAGSERTGRLSWLVATTVVSAMLQEVVDASGSRFAQKGGTLLQHRLGSVARATKDLDGIVRGDIEDFLKEMDAQLRQNWGPIGFKRTEIELINTPAKIIKPRRFEVILTLHGQTWRRVKVEISPDEGKAGSTQEKISAPSLAAIGLPSPDYLVGMAMSYQIAQKIHAATDPHDPPVFVNERARDVVDLVLLKELCESTGQPTDAGIREAVIDIFESRAAEAKTLGRPARLWPAKVTVYPHWYEDYAVARDSTGIDLELDAAVDTIDLWLEGVMIPRHSRGL
jgi:hypothetical protein